MGKSNRRSPQSADGAGGGTPSTDSTAPGHRIDLVIPAYEHLVDVIQCARSLEVTARHREQVRILIQDDCSPNVDLTLLNGASGTWEVERNPVNLGFPGNCNAGAARGTAPLIIFCNQDILAVKGMSDGWDAIINMAFEVYSEVGIVGPRLLFKNLAIQSAGGLFDRDCQPYHRCLGYANPLTAEVSISREVPWITGAFFAIRRSLFEQMGGFDTAYQGGYFEDVDMCLRVREAGYATRYEPEATLIHDVGSTGGNPHFMHNAQFFHSRWVRSGKVKPDSTVRYVNFWPGTP